MAGLTTPVIVAYMATTVYADQQAASGGGGGQPAQPTKAQELDELQSEYTHFMLIAMAATCALYFAWKSFLRLTSHIRRLHGMTNDSQRYFTRDDHRMAWFKRNIVDAPLFRVRHNREFQLSRAINMGTLPSRFQALCLVGLITMNVVLCVLHIPFSNDIKTYGDTLRNRTGTLATANLIPLVILVGRNNPLISLLGLSFDSWNFFHRWLARIVAAESLAHFLSWLFTSAEERGWATIVAGFHTSRLLITGLVATVGFVALVLFASSPLRHAFYETFLHFHILLALMAFIGLWYHLDGLPQKSYLAAALVAWGIERFIRLAINIYRNLVGGRTTAKAEALTGDATRITLKLARPWTFRPGQHVYICIPSVGLWTYHPFSVAWSEKEHLPTDEKGLVMTQQDVLSVENETISLLVRRRTGFTDTLYKRAAKGVDGRVYLSAFVEGPYGAIHDLDSYGTVLLFAGGIGITHHVPFVRHLVQGYADGTVAARRVTLVWTIQSPEHLEWVRPWMTSILQMDRRRDVLRIMLFITRPRSTKEIRSPSATVEMFPGRPNIQTVVDKEIEQQVGAMGVLVCGSGPLGDDVRRACRQRQMISNIDFIEESFTW
ncbi:ferric-chelate reductase, putative [Talaromyces stipitatus ATCC 10500]|uniref:ferric-chelate reductase (NADPH) n=1 Tax=Talaromyces stipitatus (strain ATCC 10500 / CBS 375.48 / QM 6759 / NRRL 1006) TaxID=441959 RepID=B8M5Q8_TALSN|nr:ferric-chelate reductase, putative [Talaromyces stipitatus ATCC 10500]EED19952.1 ferric-chelate reductase, putative [Talaromyces stipitatus ATCC 10500]